MSLSFPTIPCKILQTLNITINVLYILRITPTLIYTLQSHAVKIGTFNTTLSVYQTQKPVKNVFQNDYRKLKSAFTRHVYSCDKTKNQASRQPKLNVYDREEQLWCKIESVNVGQSITLNVWVTSLALHFLYTYRFAFSNLNICFAKLRKKLPLSLVSFQFLRVFYAEESKFGRFDRLIKFV